MSAAEHQDAVMSTADRLIYMANQIARNLASEGPERAIDMVTDHIRSFWDPLMRERIVALAEARPADFSPLAAAAVARIAAA